MIQQQFCALKDRVARPAMMFFFGVCVVACASRCCWGFQDDNASTADVDKELIRAEVLKLQDRVVAAFESRNLEDLIKELSPNIIVTWQNSDRNRGVGEFREFYNQMMEGGDAIVVDVKSKVEIDQPAEYIGDSTVVACGTITDEFILKSGNEFTLESKWTATLTKIEGNWKIISYHVSANVFDNPLLNAAKSYLVTFAIVGSLVGFVLGALVMWFIMRWSRKKLAV
jgi:hypothetical protein